MWQGHGRGSLWQHLAWEMAFDRSLSWFPSTDSPRCVRHTLSFQMSSVALLQTCLLLETLPLPHLGHLLGQDDCGLRWVSSNTWPSVQTLPLFLNGGRRSHVKLGVTLLLATRTQISHILFLWLHCRAVIPVKAQQLQQETSLACD